jgi:hypothetical protein
MRTLLFGSLLAVGVCCFTAFGQTGSKTFTRNFVFPPVGLGSTETAQVNVANTAAVPASVSATAPSCTGTVTFAGANGATIGKAMPFTALAGQISSVNLPFNSAGITGVRGAILVSVQQTISSNAPCQLSLSLETFDTTTGATHIFLGSASSVLPVAAAVGFEH